MSPNEDASLNQRWLALVPDCLICGKPNPAPPNSGFRRKYCSAECGRAAHQQRAKARIGRTPCAICGGAKELGVQGAKYCAECRRLKSDATQEAETERGRRRHIVERNARLAEGERLSRRSDAPDGMKWCAHCQEFRPLTSFSGYPKKAKKVAAYCKPCQKAYNQQSRRSKIYGIDYDDYEMLLACQDGKCAICQGRPRKYALAIDHDHTTGEIRGLLCSKCNHKLLGSANDDPARLRAAADYLEAFTPREVFGEPRYAPGYAAGYGDAPEAAS